jgi:hypothetical protein
VPMRVVYGGPVTHTGGDVPEWVRRLGHGQIRSTRLRSILLHRARTQIGGANSVGGTGLG